MYIKKIIGTREKLRPVSLNVSNYYLRFIDRPDFNDKILPALQRALLRSPENVLEPIAFMFNDLKIDLSSFAKDLVPTLCKQLIVKTEQTQLDAVQSVKSFVRQCSTSDTISYIVGNLFAILNGSEGKLTLPIQKSMVLTTIGNCSFNPSFSSVECVGRVLDLFSEFFKVEVNDATLHFAFEQLRVCLTNMKITSFQDEFLTKIREFFKVCKTTKIKLKKSEKCLCISYNLSRIVVD